MKTDIPETIVTVILGGILLGVVVLGVVFYRLQEQNKAQFIRYLARINRFERLTLYKIQTTPNEIISEDELCGVQHLTWDRDTITRVFSRLSWRQNERTWENGWLAVVEFNDGPHKQLLMDPAGYFKIVGDSGYYQISRDLRAEFSKNMGEICSSNMPDTAREN